MSEIIVRSSTLTGVDAKQRLIDVIAVPYGEETDVMWRGEMWREVIEPGAFKGLEDHAGRVRVNREHVKGDTVGKVTQFDTTDDRGLIARVKIAQTLRGDETLALADGDMISASIAYFVKNPSDVQINRNKNTRSVRRAFVDHLALVESPAYVGAQVLAVREGQPGPPGTPLPATPSLDALMDDEVFQWATRRLTQPRVGDPNPS